MSLHAGNHKLRAQRRLAVDVVFALLWSFVLFASVIDGYLVLINWEAIPAAEQNPVGRWLLALNGGRVWYLLGAKLAGTVLVASVVLLIYWHWRRAGLAIALALALFQLGLLAYLCLH